MSQSQSEYPVIVILDGDMANQYWVLEREEMILGRDETCDIPIPHRQISRQHALFRRQDKDTYYIRDLDSKNGTWVNGKRLEGERKLGDGDEIHIALAFRLRFIGSGVTAPVTQGLPDIIPTSNPQGRLHLDPETRQVFLFNQELDPPLSLPQYRLLELLYLANGGVCTREQVVEAVWPEAVSEGISEQAIDALVRRLRDRLSEIDPDTNYILTMRGHGFRLNNPPE